MAQSVTTESIKDKIASVQYHHFEGTTMTVCLFTLKNGYVVLGESACADPANYNAEVGERLAYAAAFDKVWALEGYLLREQLSKEEK